jgi:hypothetical protein
LPHSQAISIRAISHQPSHQREDRPPPPPPLLTNHHSQTIRSIDQNESTDHNTTTKASTIMPPIHGGTRRTIARQVRQAAIRNELEETFGISAEGQDLSQYVDHDNSDDDFNLEEEDDNADDTQIGQRLADIRNNKILFDSTFSAVQQP